MKSFKFAVSFMVALVALTGCERPYSDSEIVLKSPVQIRRIDERRWSSSGLIGGWVERTWLNVDGVEVDIPCKRGQEVDVDFDLPRRILAYRCRTPTPSAFRIVYVSQPNTSGWQEHCSRDGGSGKEADFRGFNTWEKEAPVLFACSPQNALLKVIKDTQGTPELASFLVQSVDWGLAGAQQKASDGRDLEDDWLRYTLALPELLRQYVTSRVCSAPLADTCKALAAPTLADTNNALAPFARRLRVCDYDPKSDRAACSHAATRLGEVGTSGTSSAPWLRRALYDDLAVLTAPSLDGLVITGDRCSHDVQCQAMGGICTYDWDATWWSRVQYPDARAASHTLRRIRVAGGLLGEQRCRVIRGPLSQ
jgi:hypothetical protein